MLCQQKNLHASPLCPTCWLHFLIVLCLTLSARGLHMAHAQATETVQIFPLEPTILAGTGFNLTCTVSHSSNVLAKDIAWNHNHMALPRTQFSAFDDKTSQLSVQDARFEDSGLYACFAQGISNETQVYVGEPPSEVRGLSCFSHNAWDITCSWERGKDTNLNTTYTLQYFPQHSEIKNYENCPDEYCQCKDELTCTVHDRIHGPAWFRVLSRNKLGYAISAELSFNHEEETVPYPPRNVQLKALRRSQLNVTWDLPPEWDPFYESALHYKVEYYKEGTTVLIRHPNSSNIAGKKYAILLPLPGSLDPYTTYCVRVAAKFSIGPWSEWSDTACNRTLEERPDAEVNVTWSSQINSRNDSLRDVLLKWEPLPQASARGEILGYRVIRANLSHESVTTLGPSKTSLEIPGLERYLGYIFQFEAFNGAGPSPRTTLDVMAEDKPAPLVYLTVILAILGVVLVLGIIAATWCCIKHYRLLKPVPRISIIALDRLESALSRQVRGGAMEREVFDEPRGYQTPNGVIPNGSARGGPDAGGAAARAMEDGEADYVQLREQAGPEEFFPLLLRDDLDLGGEPIPEKGGAHRKASADSASSSGVCSDREPDSPTSDVGAYSKFAKLYVQLPAPGSPHPQGPAHSGPGQPRLDSTDSGFSENGTECRVPSYTKLSTIPSDPGMDGVHLPESDYNSGALYHGIADDGLVTSNQHPLQDHCSNRTVPSYTRLSSIPAPVINSVMPSFGCEGHLTISDGTVPVLESV